MKNNISETNTNYIKSKTACLSWRILLMLAIIALLALFSVIMILFPSVHTDSGHVLASIYQDGELLETYDLSLVSEKSTYTVTSRSGRQNIIEIRPGSIGMLHADCPDHLCVEQGFLSHPSIPITCLPNSVVIELRYGDDTVHAPDAITY